jgi:Fic family protein
MFTIVDCKKKLIDQQRPLPAHTINSIRENLLLEWTYNSNAIEGNTLTLSETKVILEGITVGGKTLREHLEVINHREAIQYVEEIVKKNEPFSEWQIRNIHRLVLSKIDDENAGMYRKENVLISGAKHIPPDFLNLSGEMEQLIHWYEGEASSLHPVERAALLHVKFVKIHPFIDGNGRTSRLLLNFELMKYGYPPIVIHKETRVQYYDALDKAHTTEDCSDFVTLVIAELNCALDLYMGLLNLKL